ncbi:hypothetical protein WMF38_53625 [Sorangium sp. So ce118]
MKGSSPREAAIDRRAAREKIAAGRRVPEALPRAIGASPEGVVSPVGASQRAAVMWYRDAGRDYRRGTAFAWPGPFCGSEEQGSRGPLAPSSGVERARFQRWSP